MTIPKFKFQGLFNPIKTYLKLFVENKEYDVSLNDFADSISPLVIERLPELTYKVYTALLSQSGGGNNQILTSGAVTKGVTYRIDGSNGNFTNVGAPNNNDGTYFVATINEIPAKYGQLSYNTGAPIVNVLENTIGNIHWRYEDVGSYSANLSGAFTVDKTISIITAGSISNLSEIIYSDSVITVTTNNPLTGVASNDYLNNTPIEIRVYK